MDPVERAILVSSTSAYFLFLGIPSLEGILAMAGLHLLGTYCSLLLTQA